MSDDDLLLGRTEELLILARAIDGIRDAGGALVLRGEAGIGKTALLSVAARRAREAGLGVLSTVGYEGTARVPFRGLSEVLDPLLARIDILPAPQHRALEAAFGRPHDTAPQPFLIGLASLTLLTEAAAARPVVLVVDDAHWLDGPTQEMLTFLARRTSSDPILVIVALRDGHPSPLVSSGLPELAVRGLDDVAARALVRVHGIDLSPRDQQRIVRTARGNPLALVELPATLRARPDLDLGRATAPLPLSERLEKAFADRLDELPTRTRDALLVAAVTEETLLRKIVAAADVLAGAALDVDVLDPAEAVHLVTLDAQHVHFRHPLVRSGILQAESIPRRQAAHRALTAVLLDDAYRRTWHRAEAIIGTNDDVADELERTHVMCIQRGSVSAAIAALERSAQLTTDSATRGRRLLLAAEHAFGLGQADLVDRLLGAASRNTLSELERARGEWLREIFDDGVPGDAARVVELCEVARRSADRGDLDLALNLLLGAAMRCWWARVDAGARARVVSVCTSLEGVDEDPRHIAAIAVAEPLAASARTSARLAALMTDRPLDGDALRLLGMAAHAIGDPVRSVGFLQRAEARLREEGRLGLLTHVVAMAISDRLELGDWPRAVADMAAAQDIARDTGQPIWNIGTLALNAMLSGLRGDAALALEQAGAAEELAGGRPLNDLLACVQLARGFAHLSDGAPALAFSALRRLFDPADAAFHPTERFHGVMYLAEAAAASGNTDAAREVVDDLGALARTVVVPVLHRQLTYAEAVLADDAAAEERFLAALSQDLVRWPCLGARLELAYGAWLRGQRRAASARPLLRSALVTFEAMGARAWAEQARSELRAAGQRLEEQALPPADSVLSAQELQIAHLVAEGLSNREIGERIFLSPRTIGSHLYRMFPKLGITSRSQVAGRLAGR